MAAGAPVTAQQAHIILQSAQVFDEGVSAMNSIYSEVFTAQDTLKGQAMVTTAGSRFAMAVVEWTNDFNDIKNTLSNMSTQLRATTQQTTANNQRNVELANSVGSLQLPRS
jgi:phage terminase small subunit